VKKHSAVVGAVAVWASGAAAQSDNAILNARDAFGERVGVETVGIYTESQVRGFNLANTGAYRIEGAYFVRDATLPDTVLAGVSVRAGVNAARLAYPSPSGVVDYRLKSTKAGERTLVATLSHRELNQTVLETSFGFADATNTFGIAGGTFYTTPNLYDNEANYKVHNVGVVPQWRPTDNIRVRALGALEWVHYKGEQNFLSTQQALPPKLPYNNYGPPGHILDRSTKNFGGMVDGTFNSGWSFSATTFYTDHERSPSDSVVITLRPDRTGDAVENRTADSVSRSLSSEGVVGYKLISGEVTHNVAAAVRNRRSRVDTITLAPVAMGRINLVPAIEDDFGYRGPAPFGPAPNALQSDVDHLTASASYAAQVGSAFEIRGGLHRSRYDKTVLTPANVRSERLEKRWLYNASVVAALRPSTTLFANTVKGIEETGVAPSNALNRDEVLPPVVAEQYEVGVREALTPKLSLSVAGFEVKKAVPALRADGVFALVGDVRHRGAELSLTGEVADGTTVVLGALAMQPKLTRPGVAATKPVGVSSEVVTASINHQLRWLAEGWSVDARLAWQAGRPANIANTVSTLDTLGVSLGTRYDFLLGGKPAQFRFVAVNVGTTRPWTVGPSGLFTQSEPFRIRVSLRVNVF
jgi:iron complex outermembrane recepter protein